jgi:hypothetical protein
MLRYASLGALGGGFVMLSRWESARSAYLREPSRPYAEEVFRRYNDALADTLSARRSSP